MMGPDPGWGFGKDPGVVPTGLWWVGSLVTTARPWFIVSPRRRCPTYLDDVGAVRRGRSRPPRAPPPPPHPPLLYHSLYSTSHTHTHTRTLLKMSARLTPHKQCAALPSSISHHWRVVFCCWYLKAVLLIIQGGSFPLSHHTLWSCLSLERLNSLFRAQGMSVFSEKREFCFYFGLLFSFFFFWFGILEGKQSCHLFKWSSCQGKSCYYYCNASHSFHANILIFSSFTSFIIHIIHHSQRWSAPIIMCWL